MWADYRTRVQPDWLDGNGHMNLAYYVLVFDRGTDAWLDLAGLGAAYRAATARSVFAVETHTLYRQEVRLDAPLHVRSRAAAAGGKRIHLLHEMQSDSALVAMQEVLFLHVDLTTRRTIPLAADAAAQVAALLPPPDVGLPSWAGRRLGDRPEAAR